MSKKQRLELTWIGKDDRPKLEPRILIEDSSLSYSVEQLTGGADDNLLIKGDNLLALRALEQEYAGKIKCIFIDPPYNTGAAFPNYDDGLEHSIWLSLMRDRIEIIHSLLSSDGSLWIAIDDNEVHYLKVLCDEIFGRHCFVASIVWQSKDTPSNNATQISQTHNYILVYSRNENWKPNLIPRNESQIGTYKNLDDDPRGPWLGSTLTRAEVRERDIYPLTSPDGRKVMPPKGSSWRRPPEELQKLIADNRVYWGQNGKAEFPKEKKFLTEVKEGIVPQTWWPYEFAGSTRNATAEIKSIFDGERAFETPKPERLLMRILQLSTDEGDIVLDSFAGSGTTGAVAHKMGRRWILVELGSHAETLVRSRLKRVIDGNDDSGVTKEVKWTGGGGFRYYTLAPSLLEKDRYGNWVISKKYNANMLAAAVCKLMGFTYDPSHDEREYWHHGHSTETDFIYVTTQSLTYDALKRLSEDVGRKRTLLVCCKAYNAKDDAFENLTLRKIPQVVLKKCEWGRDDYSLKIAKAELVEESTAAPAKIETETADTVPKKRTRKPRKNLSDEATPDMFARRVGG